VSHSPGQRLRQHLRIWLGQWKEDGQTTVDVVGSEQRQTPGWDGRVFPVVGVASPEGGVISVNPVAALGLRPKVEHLTAMGVGWIDLVPMLPTLLERADKPVYSGIFRWCERPAELPDGGEWIDAADPSVPAWLRPFCHEVLIAWDPETGEYLAGVGIKHHDAYGQELAVGTEEAARNKGLARRLVAQAARRVLDEGGVPTYQHDPANVASARVAEASGFPDRGWRSAGMP
jgi:GNAT superfamily N-acetyltransferase